VITGTILNDLYMLGNLLLFLLFFFLNVMGYREWLCDSSRLKKLYRNAPVLWIVLLRRYLVYATPASFQYLWRKYSK